MKRKISLLLSALFLHSSWGPELKWLCNPVLSCHSCALAWFACPVGVFVHYSGYHVFPFIALGTVLLVGVLLGRLLCGWVCPLGLVQDLLHRIPTPKIQLPDWTAQVKYLVLFLSVFLFPFFLGEETWLSFCRICPAAALQVSIPGLIAGGASSVSAATLVRFVFLGLIVVLAIVSNRSFCQVLCPIGALLAPLNLVSFWQIKPPRENCLECRKCDKSCPMTVTPSARILNRIPANRALDCIVCHECQDACAQINPCAPRS